MRRTYVSSRPKRRLRSIFEALHQLDYLRLLGTGANLGRGGLRITGSLVTELDRIAGMNINELRSLWREREGREPPSGFSKDLLARALAYGVQEEQLGGLSSELKKLLAGPDGHADPRGG